MDSDGAISCSSRQSLAMKWTGYKIKLKQDTKLKLKKQYSKE